jgi:hypothetical protein
MIDHVTNLLYGYCHAVDRGTTEDVLRLFASDAALVMDENEAAGHDAIRTFYDGYFALSEDTAMWVRHRLTSPFVQLGDDGTAQCVSYADVQSLWKTGSVMNIVVMYEDIVERVGDTTEWLFRKRTQTTVGAFEVAHT